MPRTTWADYRLTDYASIERWWELVMSAYTLVSVQTRADEATGAAAMSGLPTPLVEHPARDMGTGWKHHLNTLRLLLLPWLPLLPHAHATAIQSGFAALASLANTFRLALPT